MVESRENISFSSSYERKDLEFFKVFLPEFASRELVIPPAFTDILDKPLPKEVSLLDEVGRLWYVETKTLDTNERFRVVFQKGWKVFANDQSLEFGDFLVFKYDGGSRFSVTIFANDGIKKDLGAVTTTDRPRVSLENEKPVCAKPVDSFSKPERRRGCGMKLRKRKQEAVKEESIDFSESEPESISTSETEPVHRQLKRTRREVNRVEDTCDVPENPYFLRNITHSSIQKLTIPTTFLKSNGIELEDDIQLCDENGEKWSMKIESEYRGGGPKFSHESWSCFSKNHELMKNKKYLFEFIVPSNGRCNEIQVRIVSGRLPTTMTKTKYQVLAM